MRWNNFLKEGKDCAHCSGESNADILLVQCPPWDIAMPPLGIAFLSSYLKKYGYKVSVLDLNISLYQVAPQNLKYLWEQKSYNHWVDDELFKDAWFSLEGAVNKCLLEVLQKTDTKYLGLSVNFAGIKFAGEAVKIIKRLRSEIKIILGGWGCVTGHMRSLFPKELIDCFVVGEGEETLREVLEAFSSQKETNGIAGAVFSKDSGQIYKPRPAIMNLDEIPWPTYAEFNLKSYKQRDLPLFTSRGCIGNCSFCNDWRLLQPYRYRSARNIFEEIKYHVTRNNIKNFSFKDLLCNGKISELELLCDLIIDAGLKINWDSQAIPRKEMTYELLCKLKRSGCGALIYGVESFSGNVLKRMRKIFTKEAAETVLRDTHRAGINAIMNIIVGFPQESETDFQETYEAIERNQRYISRIGAISVCLVNNDSEFDIHPGAYGLVLPADLRIRAKEWVSADGKNTYEMRKERAERIIELINRIGFSYVTINI